jgi:flagellar protein FliS
MTGSVHTYRDVYLSTMDRGRLLLAMYEGAIGFLKQATSAHEQDDIQRFSQCLRRGQDVIGELMSSLDHEPAPRLASMLERLYDFMLFQLTEANIRREPGSVRQVTAILARIYDAYRQVILNPTQEVREILSRSQGTVR